MGELLTPKEVSATIKVSTETLARWRRQRVGPPWTKTGRQVRYRAEDVTRWVELRISRETQ